MGSNPISSTRFKKRNLHHLRKRPILKINLGDKPLIKLSRAPLSLSITGTCLLLLRHALIGHEPLVWSKQ